MYLFYVGTVNTGAFDDFLQLSSIARAEQMWFHVDGAFGSFVILDPQRRHLVQCIDQADSLAFDFHKWLHCPFAVGCILVQDKSLLRSVFSSQNSYLDSTKGLSRDYFLFSDFGPEVSRPSRALKVWFTLKEHGTVKLGQKIAENCEQAKYLVSLLEKHEPIIYILRPVTLNIVNFRFQPEILDNTDHALLDSFNRELVRHIRKSGVAMISPWNIRNRQYIRVAILNHRSVCADLDKFMETLLDIYQTQLQALTMENGST